MVIRILQYTKLYISKMSDPEDLWEGNRLDCYLRGYDSGTDLHLAEPTTHFTPHDLAPLVQW